MTSALKTQVTAIIAMLMHRLVRSLFRRRWTGSMFFLLAASSTVAQPTSNEQSLATAARHIEALLVPQAEAEFLSGVILVARGDQILFHRAYGFANWELRTPNTRMTRFGVASITKPMTATLVGLLVRAGRLELGAPVDKYLPGFPRGPKGGPPSIGHLLTHRSGVPHRVTDALDEMQALHPSDIVRRVQAAGLLFEPGSRRLYSSAGYTCLARVIEVVENKPFELALAERILGPAGMASAVSETGQSLMPHRAMPYRLGAENRKVAVKSAPYKDLRFLTGAGSVFATAQDLLRFLQAIHDGTFGGGLWDQMFGSEAASWSGWTGRANGYEASVDVFPAQNLIFVFLSNLRSAANWQTRERIQDILLGRTTGSVPLPPPVADEFEEPESLVGSYGPARIMLAEGRLFRGDNEVYPIEGGRYYIPASGSLMRFRRDSDGVVDAIISLRGGGKETVLLRSSGR